MATGEGDSAASTADKLEEVLRAVRDVKTKVGPLGNPLGVHGLALPSHLGSMPLIAVVLVKFWAKGLDSLLFLPPPWVLPSWVYVFCVARWAIIERAAPFCRMLQVPKIYKHRLNSQTFIFISSLSDNAEYLYFHVHWCVR